jgi:hypothetical protein
MPGNVWWRSWRELPPKAPFPDCQSTDPDFSWQGQGQWPMGGYWQTYTDPQSGQKSDVWEGHYTYPGTSLTFIPTYGGGMFEALMPNIVVPETSCGTSSFGLADVRTVQQACANIAALRADYPGLYGTVGFYDAVNPVTGAVGHRDLVLDQSMIMASLDNALNDRAIQRDFARDPVAWAAHEYLSIETMSIAS